MCIVEPLVLFSSVAASYCSSLNLKLIAINSPWKCIPTLWVLVLVAWTDFSVVSMDEQQISFEVNLNGVVHLFY